MGAVAMIEVDSSQRQSGGPSPRQRRGCTRRPWITKCARLLESVRHQLLDGRALRGVELSLEQLDELHGDVFAVEELDGGCPSVGAQPGPEIGIAGQRP